MSPHLALRLAARPLRGVTLLDQLGAAASLQPLPRVSPICLRCRIPAGPRSGAAHTRLFSTAPPPPKQPSRDDGSDSNTSAKTSTSSQESSNPQDAPSTTATTPSPPPPPEPENPEQHNQLGPEPSAQPEAQPEPAPSEPSPPPPHPQSNGTPSESTLPSFTETHRHPLSARFSTFMDNLQSRAVTATQTLNDLTGYSSIEAIKAQNERLEAEHAAAQARLRAARQNYKSLTSHRATTQREVTTLLARKDTWNPLDLERFTSLYRSDHELESQVNAAAVELTEAESDEGRLSSQLNQGILRRYHEEQIWSDRIRRQSTWGTWGLIGVNILLFLGLQFVAEPWRRKRMIKGIAETEKGVMDEVRRELGEVKAALEASGLREAAAAVVARAEGEVVPGVVEDEGVEGFAEALDDMSVPEMAAAEPVQVQEEGPRKPWKEVMEDYWADPEQLKTDVQDKVQDLYSERKPDLRMRDVSLIALQGAAAGATVVATLAFALLRGSRS